MKLNNRFFLIYKLFNSSFTGLSIGILFTIYQPLNPSVYSIGGIILALFMLLIAKYYEQLLNIRYFYYISLLVEYLILTTIIIFMFSGYSLTTALLIYIGYQITFVFGGYLVRAETLVAEKKEFLSKIDIYKQIGYLIGLFESFIFYKILEIRFKIVNPKLQIDILHYLLLITQVVIIILLIKSFRKK